MTLPAFGTRVVFCRYSPLLYRFKTLSSWAAVSSIPQWSSPLKAEEKNDLDEELPAQDKARFHLDEALSLGALGVLLHGRAVTWAGNPWDPTSQVSHLTWPRHSRGWLIQLVSPGLQTQNTQKRSTSANTGNSKALLAHWQSIICLLISPASFIFPSDATLRHWKTTKSVLQAITLVSEPLPW